MKEKNILITNITKCHTTKLGENRISKNLSICSKDVTKYYKEIIQNPESTVYKKGKNYYCNLENITITINSYTYTIITAHLIK